MNFWLSPVMSPCGSINCEDGCLPPAPPRICMRDHVCCCASHVVGLSPPHEWIAVASGHIWRCNNTIAKRATSHRQANANSAPSQHQANQANASPTPCQRRRARPAVPRNVCFLARRTKNGASSRPRHYNVTRRAGTQTLQECCDLRCVLRRREKLPTMPCTMTSTA